MSDYTLSVAFVSNRKIKLSQSPFASSSVCSALLMLYYCACDDQRWMVFACIFSSCKETKRQNNNNKFKRMFCCNGQQQNSSKNWIDFGILVHFYRNSTFVLFIILFSLFFLLFLFWSALKCICVIIVSIYCCCCGCCCTMDFNLGHRCTRQWQELYGRKGWINTIRTFINLSNIRASHIFHYVRALAHTVSFVQNASHVEMCKRELNRKQKSKW